MNSELKILQALWDFGGEAPFYTVVKTAGFGTDYGRIICRTLGQHDYLDWMGSNLILRPKGKLEVAKLKATMAEEERRFKAKEEAAEKEVSRISEKLPPHHKIGGDENVIAENHYSYEGEGEIYPSPSRRRGQKGRTVLGY